MKRAVYPGSFDPATNGHLDIIRRSANQVTHLIVAVLDNMNKRCLFSVDERVEILRKLTEDLPNVEVKHFSGLLVDFMKQENADLIIRGFRAISDYEFEIQLAQTNYSLNPDIETIFLVTRNEYSYLSSSIVKEVASHGGDVSHMVPAYTEQLLIKKYEAMEVEK